MWIMTSIVNRSLSRGVATVFRGAAPEFGARGAWRPSGLWRPPVSGLALLFSCLTCALAQPAASTRLHTTGIVGHYHQPNGLRKVLIRWYAMDGQSPFDAYTVYRKAGGPHAPGTFVLRSRSQPLRSDLAIRSVFEAHGDLDAGGNNPLLDDLLRLLGDIADVPVTAANYPQVLIATLEADANEGFAEFRRHLLTQAHYGVAIVEGQGFLDLEVPPGVHTYEVRGLQGGRETVVGRVFFDTTLATSLPAPSTLTEVVEPGLLGDRIVHLRWKFAPELRRQLGASFGFNVYRAAGPSSVATEAAFQAGLDDGSIQQLNDVPVLLGNSEEGESGVYLFTDDNGRIDLDNGTIDEARAFVPGTTYSYFVAARDLLGQRGRASMPLAVTIRDQRPPPAPRGLEVWRVRHSDQTDRLQLSWRTHPDGDTTAYRVYRSPDFAAAGTSNAAAIATVPHDPAPSHTRFVDDTTSERERLFWYTLTAVDAAGNESPHTPPVRGVLYDFRPPARVIPDTIETVDCVSDAACVSNTRLPTFGPASTAHMRFIRQDANVDGVTVLAEDRYGERYQILDEDFGPGSNQFDYVRAVPYQLDCNTNGLNDVKLIIVTHFEDDSVRGEQLVCKFLDLWAKDPSGAPLTNAFHDIVLGVTLDRDCGTAARLDDGTTRVHQPLGNGGIDPLVYRFAITGDVTAVRCYVSEDCAEYRFAEEKAVDDSGQLVFTNRTHPDSSQAMCVGFRSVDEDGNLGPMTRMSPIIVAGRPLPPPAIVSALPAGTREQPAAHITFASLPPEVVQGFEITLRLDEAGAEPIVVVPRPADRLAHDGTVYTYTLGRNIEPGVPYTVEIVAIDKAALRSPPSHRAPFVWAMPSGTDDLPWPLRPSTLVVPDLAADGLNRFQPHPGNHLLLGFGEMVPHPISPVAPVARVTVADLDIRPPFIVYRSRVRLDGSLTPWYQASPLIRHVPVTWPDPAGNTAVGHELGVVVANPYLISDTARSTAFSPPSPDHFPVTFRDSNALRAGSTYRYIVLQLDDRGEIRKSFGPSNPVVANP